MWLCLAVAGVKCKQPKTTCIFTCILLTGRASAFHLSLSHDFRLNNNECSWSAAALCSLFILVLVFRGGTKTVEQMFLIGFEQRSFWMLDLLLCTYGQMCSVLLMTGQPLLNIQCWSNVLLLHVHHIVMTYFSLLSQKVFHLSHSSIELMNPIFRQ